MSQLKYDFENLSKLYISTYVHTIIHIFDQFIYN